MNVYRITHKKPQYRNSFGVNQDDAYLKYCHNKTDRINTPGSSDHPFSVDVNHNIFFDGGMDK